MPCGAKLNKNKNAKSDLTLTPDNLDYIFSELVRIIFLECSTFQEQLGYRL